MPPRRRKAEPVIDLTHDEDEAEAEAPKRRRASKTPASAEKRAREDGTTVRFRSHPTPQIEARMDRALSTGAGKAQVWLHRHAGGSTAISRLMAWMGQVK